MKVLIVSKLHTCCIKPAKQIETGSGMLLGDIRRVLVVDTLLQKESENGSCELHTEMQHSSAMGVSSTRRFWPCLVLANFHASSGMHPMFLHYFTAGLEK